MIKSQWKDIFKKDIRTKVKIADEEYKKFRSTKQIIYLQQAGNKLFSAVENYLMLKYEKRVKNYQILFNIVKHNEKDRIILREAAQLHYFFYNGELDMPVFEAEDFYKSVSSKMKKRLKNANRNI